MPRRRRARRPAAVLLGGLGILVMGIVARGQQALPPPQAAPDVTMNGPHLSFAGADWNAALATLPAADPAAPNISPSERLSRLNAAAAKLFPAIAASPIPVLLPFDTAGLARGGAPDGAHAAQYVLGNEPPAMFFAGPSGYDALFMLQPKNLNGLDLTFANRIELQISGSLLVYDLDPPALSEQAPVPELAADFPDLSRVLLEERLRYTFTRFGVPYVVAIKCFDGAVSARRLACREADKVAVRVVKALAVTGGAPAAATAADAPRAIEAPRATSPDFTYYAPGDLLPGTGTKGQGGRADATVYAKIRFPIAQAPAYVNSQSFMNWGDCNFTGRVGSSGDGDTAAYHCQVNAVPLVQDESKNYAYPWRDNFCEHRDYYVGQCPAGLGHQGEDIRPGSCLLRNDHAGRCDPYQHDIVAVHDGMLMRNPGEEALYLIVNSPGAHIRFRYLHMDPQMLDAAGMVNGRMVAEGEVLGAVDNYGRSQGGTSYHLHFNVQVLTRDGWVFVNPYMTLVASYQRLIGGRGRVVRDAPRPPPPLTNASSDTTPSDPAAATDTRPTAVVAQSKDETESHHGERGSGAERCTTRIVKGHRRRLCRPDRSEDGGRGRNSVRSVDRHVSRQSDGARHRGGDLHARHGQSSSRHLRQDE
jgi:hypothetical protein